MIKKSVFLLPMDISRAAWTATAQIVPAVGTTGVDRGKNTVWTGVLLFSIATALMYVRKLGRISKNSSDLTAPLSDEERKKLKEIVGD